GSHIWLPGLWPCFFLLLGYSPGNASGLFEFLEAGGDCVVFVHFDDAFAGGRVAVATRPFDCFGTGGGGGFEDHDFARFGFRFCDRARVEGGGGAAEHFAGQARGLDRAEARSFLVEGQCLRVDDRFAWVREDRRRRFVRVHRHHAGGRRASVAVAAFPFDEGARRRFGDQFDRRAFGHLRYGLRAGRRALDPLRFGGDGAVAFRIALVDRQRFARQGRVFGFDRVGFVHFDDAFAGFGDRITARPT